MRPGADGSISAERFAEAIDERTALVCCTTISYRSGHRHDVAAIAEAAHAAGALVLADSYQACGAVELDVRRARRRRRHGRHGQVPARHRRASASCGCGRSSSATLAPDADRLVRRRGHLRDVDRRLLAPRERAAVRLRARRRCRTSTPASRGSTLVAGDRRAGDRGARPRPRDAPARRARRARRDGRDAARSGRAAARSSASARPTSRRSSPTLAGGADRQLAARRRTCASRSTSTTSRTTSTGCSTRSAATARCSPDDARARRAQASARAGIAYGDHPDQVANLHLPAAEGGPWPCVVLIHGGFWRTGWDRTLMTPLAVDLARHGIAAWNLEYRRVGQEGGGWPGTLADVGRRARPARRGRRRRRDAGSRRAATRPAVTSPLWLAARHRLPPGAPGAGPRVRPVAAVAQAGVLDLHRGHEEGLGGGAVAALLGAPEATPGALRRRLARGARAARRRPAPRPRHRGRHRARHAEPDPRRARPAARSSSSSTAPTTST